MGLDVMADDTQIDTGNQVQQYAGTDEDAMATAKRRMAERDAEYSSKFNDFASGNRKSPSVRGKSKTAVVADKNYSNEGRSVPAPKVAVADYSNEGKSVPAPVKLDTPSVEVKPVVVESPAVSPTDVSYSDASNGSGLRGLKGSSEVPKNDQEEYSDAWKTLK
jgi:hypothetical protein